MALALRASSAVRAPLPARAVMASRKREPRYARVVARLGLPGLAKQPGPPHPAPGVRPRARCASTHRASASLATLGSLLGSAFQASPSNPALRILLRAFDLARDALQRIAQALGLTLSRSRATIPG